MDSDVICTIEDNPASYDHDVETNSYQFIYEQIKPCFYNYFWIELVIIFSLIGEHCWFKVIYILVYFSCDDYKQKFKQ